MWKTSEYVVAFLATLHKISSIEVISPPLMPIDHMAPIPSTKAALSFRIESVAIEFRVYALRINKRGGTILIA